MSDDRALGAWRPRPAAIPLALLLDRLLGEPPNGLHPVVWIGRVTALLESRAPTDSPAAFAYGTGLTFIVVGGAAASGVLLRRLIEVLPGPIGLLAEAWLLKTMLSVRALVEAGREVELCLQRDAIDEARRAATALVSRDTSALSAPLLASAAVESLAENTADSIVGPLLAYAAGGLPATLGYRACNTLDAMIGYHGRYEHLGKAAARLDDVANLLPSRLAALLLLTAGALSGGQVKAGLDRLSTQRQRTASPNAGWPISAMAGLLGVTLEKPGHYRLGDPAPEPDLPAIDHASQIVIVATLLTGLLTTMLAWLRRP
jgi:adenosylcobinamide-phosphate synthase